MLKKAKHFANLESFIKLIVARIYGDDGMYAVHPSIVDLINFITLKAEFDLIGMECTPATKDEKILKYQFVVELEFLKRHTKRIGAFFYGLLNKTSFSKMLNFCLGPAHHWYQEKRKFAWPMREQDLIQTGNSALMEAMFYGQEFYDYIKNHLDTKFHEFGIDHRYPRFKDMISFMELPLPKSF